MHRVNLLRHYGVKPILVFDGGLLPMKIEQENKRARYVILPLEFNHTVDKVPRNLKGCNHKYLRLAAYIFFCPLTSFSLDC